MTSHSSTGWRATYDNAENSEWMEFAAGEYYPIRIFHHGNEYDHYTISLEFEKEGADETWFEEVTQHFHAQREIQQLLVEQTNVPESWDVTITNPNRGETFKIMFVYENNKGKRETWKSDEINAFPSAWELNRGINGYFNS